MASDAGLLKIRLFKRLGISFAGSDMEGFDSSKVRDLLCFLLLHRDKPHSREVLASLLWSEQCTTSQSRKYLRNALWRLHSAIGQYDVLEQSGLLSIDPEWVTLRSVRVLWLDLSVFEKAYQAAKGAPGGALSAAVAEQLRQAVALYSGELLENCYEEWCLFERERMAQLYFSMLDKLVLFSESQGSPEAALSYANEILKWDPARERTHYLKMRILYQSGDRTGALRQFGKCERTLRRELDIEPCDDTLALYEEVKQGRLHFMRSAGVEHQATAAAHDMRALDQLDRDTEKLRRSVDKVLTLLRPDKNVPSSDCR